MATRVCPSVAESRELRASARPSRRASLDLLIKRVWYAPDPRLLTPGRHVDPDATLITDWPAFAAAYVEADVNVVFPGASGDDLAPRLHALARKHCLPSLIVVTPLDVEHLLPFRRVPVDEFVAPASLATDLPLAVVRGLMDPLREHLALHVERLEQCGPELRAALARVLRRPNHWKTIRALAAAETVTPRTLANQWRGLGGAAPKTRLQDLLWIIRLLEVLELRARGAPLGGICRDLGVDLRSLQRASRRHLATSLGRVSPAAALIELLRLRRCTVKLFRGVEAACQTRG